MSRGTRSEGREGGSGAGMPPLVSGEEGRREPDFVEALARGLKVLASFSPEHGGPRRGRMILSEVAARTGLSRGTARRLLLTLRSLSYIDTDGRFFWLTPKVLQFSNAYLNPLGLGDAAKAIIRDVTNTLNESSSVGVLDGPDVVYVARFEVRRLYSSGIDVGTRLPAHCSSLGRVLLASLPHEQLQHWLSQHELKKLTPKTITDLSRFHEEIARVRGQKYAVIDEELEIGIRSVAVPIVGQSGRTIASLNASASTARISIDTIANVFVPRLHAAAGDLSVVMDW